MSGVKGRSGRRPIPDEIKKERGTYREPPIPIGPPVNFPVKELTAPPHVEADQYAIEEWNRIVPLLDSVRILTDPDLAALSNYCLLCSVAIRAAMDVTAKPLLLETETGGLKPNPSIKIANDARAQCLRYMIEFGLTPAARTRVAGQKPTTTKDPAEEFLFHPPVLVTGT